MVPGELVDEERAAAGLQRQALCTRARNCAVITEAREGQLTCGLRRECADLEVPTARLRLLAVLDHREQWTVGGVVTAITRDQQNGRRIRRTQQIAQEDSAVQVTPLQIVDVENHGASRTQVRKELA